MTKLKSLLINLTPLLVAQMLIVVVSYVNIFPKDYIFAAHDFSFPLDIQKFVYAKRFLWSDYFSAIGQSSFTYSDMPFYFLIGIIRQALHLDNSSQSFIYYLLFLSGSLWAMAISISLIDRDRKVGTVLKTLISLAYALNSYTFYIFYFQYGFTPFNYLYILFPVQIALTYKILTTPKEKSILYPLSCLTILFYLTNVTNSNIPYFFSSNILYGIFVLGMVIGGVKKNGFRYYLTKIFFIYLLYALSVSWSLIPPASEYINEYKKTISGQKIYSLRDWMFFHALAYADIFTSSPPFRTYYLYRPDLLGSLASFSWGLTLILSFLLVKKNGVFINTMLTVLLTAIIFAVKLKYLVNPDLAWQIFKFPLFASIRSYEKSLIFIPPLIFIILVNNLINGKYKKLGITLVLFFVLSQIYLSYPLWAGKVIKEYSFLVAGTYGQNYKTSAYSTLVKIPESYYEVAKLLNKDGSDHRILSFPYSALIPGFADYPMWGIRSYDPTLQLFNAFTLQPNAYETGFSKWNYGDMVNKQTPAESEWFLRFCSLVNIKYIIYHKDVPESYVTQSLDKINYWVENEYISKIYSSEHFDVFELAEPFLTSKFYVPNTVINENMNITDLPAIINKYNPTIPFLVNLGKKRIPDVPLEVRIDVSYKEINPGKYEITLKGAYPQIPLAFSEYFHDGWVLRDKDSGKKVVTHFVTNGFLNGWVLPPHKCSNQDCTKKYVAEFGPQILYNLTFFISFATVALAIVAPTYICIKPFLNSREIGRI